MRVACVCSGSARWIPPCVLLRRWPQALCVAHACRRTARRRAGRFNERLVLSLAECPACILMDDEMNVLPTSSHVRAIKPLALDADGAPLDLPGRAAADELKALVATLEDTQPAGALTATCHSLDQAKAVLTFLDAASEKLLRTTVALTAARGRGKSAATGLAIAGAIALGYSNIFVTAPSPENLRTLFEFVFKGLDALEYKEHMDYDIMESTNRALGKAIVRVNVYRSHRQARPRFVSRLCSTLRVTCGSPASGPCGRADDSVHPAAALRQARPSGAARHRRGRRHPAAAREEDAGAVPGLFVLHRQWVRTPLHTASHLPPACSPVGRWFNRFL